VNIVTVKSFVRNDLNGTWEENQIVQGSFPSGENYSVRDLQIYMDQQTGLEYIFGKVGTQGIYKGKYNPSIPGKVDWIITPEFSIINLLGETIVCGRLSGLDIIDTSSLHPNVYIIRIGNESIKLIKTE
jgi:hypothetical protein